MRHTSRDDPATVWLLASNEPAIRRLTLTEVLGASPDEPDVVSARREFASGPIAAALLGDSTDHVYHKWRGAFWRLTALAELGVPSGEHRALGLLDEVLAWLQALERRGYPPVVAGLHRAHACWHGNALSAAVELGRARDPMATDLARRLVEWQWPDGGWNCDRRPGARTSSVHESLGPLLGLAGYHRATGDAASSRAAQRAAEFFFERRLFRSRRTGEVIHPAWLRFRQPTYYHYDVLQALWVLSRAGCLPDPRAAEAVQLVVARRRRDGRWDANGRWWRPPGAQGSSVEAADWGQSRPSQMVTLKALAVLRGAEEAT